MESLAVDATSPSETPLNRPNSVPVSPKSSAPRHTVSAQDDDSKVEEGVHSPAPENINALSFKFLVKVQQVFGRHSREWVGINRALLEFKQGAMSKKDTHEIMVKALGDNHELSYDLFNILDHDDADWGPDDWSQPINPPSLPQNVSLTSPNFLQPSHELQSVRLPSMFQALGGGSSYTSRSQSSINPTFLQPSSMPYTAEKMTPNPYHSGQGRSDFLAASFEGYSGYESHQEPFMPHSQGLPNNWTANSLASSGLSSPSYMMSNMVPLSQHYASPSWHQDQTLAPSRVVHRELGLQSYTKPSHPKESLSPAMYTADQAHQQQYPHHHWQYGHSMGGWAGDGSWQREQNRGTAEYQALRIAPSPQEQVTPQLTPGQLSSDVSPSTIATPVTGVANLPELPQDELEQGQLEYTASMRNFSADATNETYEDADTNSVGTKSGENEMKFFKTQPDPRSEGSFIHAICGKGFHSRSAVKKHHWGPKAGDLATSRGCWAKNKKPDVAWDAHPSCNLGFTKSNTKNSCFPATEADEFVSTGATLNAGPAATRSPQRLTVQQFNDAPARELDTLVSAALFTKTVDAPKPQNGRNDSVVFHLDAQAAAAERNHMTLPPWSTPSGFGTALTGTTSYSHMQPTVADLDNTHDPSNPVPSNMMLPSQHLMSFAPHGGQKRHAQATQDDDAPPKLGLDAKKKRQRATSKKAGASKREQKQAEPVAPSTNRKKVKVKE